MPVDAFRSTAHLYAVLSDTEQRLTREGPLLLEMLARAPGRRVVDVACGTGLHAAFLAEHGASVTALDLSPEMIAHAAERRAGAPVEFRRGDMRALEGGPWDLALCLGNSLSALSSHQEVVHTLGAVYAALNPGGLFLVQGLNYRSAAAAKPRHRVERKQAGGAEIVAVKSLVPHRDRTLLSLAFFDVGTGAPSALAEAAVLLNITEQQLVKAARDTGFEVGEVYGGFDQSRFIPEESGDLVCVFAKL